LRTCKSYTSSFQKDTDDASRPLLRISPLELLYTDYSRALFCFIRKDGISGTKEVTLRSGGRSENFGHRLLPTQRTSRSRGSIGVENCGPPTEKDCAPAQKSLFHSGYNFLDISRDKALKQMDRKCGQPRLFVWRKDVFRRRGGSQGPFRRTYCSWQPQGIPNPV
jgi:hypothetical protein